LTNAETPGSTEAGSVTIHVCVTCRKAAGSEERPGAELFRTLAAGSNPHGFRVEAVECLSVCKRPCTVAVSSPGPLDLCVWRPRPATAADTILAGAALYARTADGIVPWRERPEALRKGVVARIPPFPAAPRGGRRMSDLSKIPCTIVTGFLGAGKTTLVRHLLENAGGRRLACWSTSSAISASTAPSSRAAASRLLGRGHRRTAEWLYLLHGGR
jgi:predicted metal-binding protein